MIVEPDFFGHWKTQMLVGLTQEEPSPLYVIRLWAFCHQRRAWVFENMTPVKLKAICWWKGDADEFWGYLHACEFVRDEDGQFVVHDWDTVNSTLVRNWKNGKAGGRPRRTQPEPTENPTGTHGEPNRNPKLTEGKGREGKGKKKVPKKKATATPIEDFEQLLATDRFKVLDTPDFRGAYQAFIHYRQCSKKKITTRRTVELHLIDALKVGADVATLFLIDAEKNSWTGWFFVERVEEYRLRAKKKTEARTTTRRYEGT